MTGDMKEQDRKIVLELKRRLSADLQKRVIKFILYGSRARGTDAEDSDLDLVALVDEKTPEILHIHSLEYERRGENANGGDPPDRKGEV